MDLRMQNKDETNYKKTIQIYFSYLHSLLALTLKFSPFSSVKLPQNSLVQAQIHTTLKSFFFFIFNNVLNHHEFGTKLKD
jgi:succinate dehydrogenase/fumarate reductase cytochrome b subunit